MLGTIIEQNGDGLLEQSHMPVGWPLHIDGAVRQSYAHRDTTLQELDNLLGEYDLKRELSRNQPQSTPMVSEHCVEQTIYGAKARFRPTTTVGELRVSYHTENIPLLWGERQWYPPGVMALTAVPAATLPESAFLSALQGRPCHMKPKTRCHNDPQNKPFPAWPLQPPTQPSLAALLWSGSFNTRVYQLKTAAYTMTSPMPPVSNVVGWTASFGGAGLETNGAKSNIARLGLQGKGKEDRYNRIRLFISDLRKRIHLFSTIPMQDIRSRWNSMIARRMQLHNLQLRRSWREDSPKVGSVHCSLKAVRH